MSGKLLSFKRPERVDYCLLALVALYAAYSFWTKDMIVDPSRSTIPAVMHVVLLIFPLLALGLVLLILSRGLWSGSRLGLELGRRAYVNFVISFLLAAAFFINIEGPRTPSYSVGRLILITINATAGVVVLRAVVMELMMKVFGKTAVGVGLGFILSVALYVVVQVPSGASLSWPISWGTCGCFMYYATPSALFLVLLDTWQFLPALDMGGHGLLAGMVVVFYFALAGAASKLSPAIGQNIKVISDPS